MKTGTIALFALLVIAIATLVYLTYPEVSLFEYANQTECKCPICD